MDTCQVILFLFPHLVPLQDFTVVDDGDERGPVIAEWRAEGIEQPTDKELEAAEPEALAAAEAQRAQAEAGDKLRAALTAAAAKVTDPVQRARYYQARAALTAAAAKVTDPVQRARYYQARAALTAAMKAGESPEVIKALVNSVDTTSAAQLDGLKTELLATPELTKARLARAE